MRRRGVRRTVRGAAWTLIGLGVFVLYFIGYELFGTNAITAHDQQRLRIELRHDWSYSAAADPPTASIPVGHAYALLVIPKIHLDMVVVQGTSTDDLIEGPGHITSTVGPGQPGTFAVSGHRTTYLHPFWALNELAPGDRIIVATRSHVYTYRVTHLAAVAPTDLAVLRNIRGPDGKLEAQIVLTTCTPRFSAVQRLVAFGLLSQVQPNDATLAA